MIRLRTIHADLSTWLLTLVLISAPLYVVRFTIGGIPFTFLEIILILSSGYVIFASLYTNQLSAYQRAILIFGFSLIAMSLFSLFVTPNFLGGLGIWKSYIVEPVIYAAAVMVHVRRKEQLQILLGGAAAAASVISITALIQYITGWAIPSPWTNFPERRSTAIYGFPNAVGLYIAPIVAGACGMFLRRKTAFIALGVALLGGAALLAARADGAIVGVVVAVSIMLLTKPRWRWWTVGAGILGCIGICSIPALREIVLFQDTSGQVRLALWQGTWNLLSELPLYGAGLGGFPATYDLYRLPSHVELLLYPHNIFLNFWVEIGITGVIWITTLLIVVFFTIARYFRTHEWLALPMLGVFTCLVVYGMVDVVYFKNDLSLMFWFYCSLVALLPTLPADAANS